MMRTYRLLFGPLAAVILAFGIVRLAMLVPGYSHVRQTVSEIGEVGSPARVPFTAMLIATAACLLLFARGLGAASREAGRSLVAAYLTGAMAVSAVGVGVFAYPHPLHSVFGLSELVGYQAPLALALTWRRVPRAGGVVLFSAVMAVLVWIAIGFNLSTLDRNGGLWALERPVYGLVQRALFATWFVWAAGAGVMLFNWSGGARALQRAA